MAQQNATVGFNQPAGPDYTDQQNTQFGFWNSKGQLKLGGNPDISNEYISPATQPQFLHGLGKLVQAAGELLHHTPCKGTPLVASHTQKAGYDGSVGGQVLKAGGQKKGEK